MSMTDVLENLSNGTEIGDDRRLLKNIRVEVHTAKLADDSDNSR